jgi:GTP-binding protein Era
VHTLIPQAIEVVRECVYQRLHEELPYSIVPIHDSWENFDNGSFRIEHMLMAGAYTRPLLSST